MLSTSGAAAEAKDSVVESELDREKELPVVEHMEELRRRVIVCLVVWLVASCVSYYYSSALLELIRGLSSDRFSFVYTSPTEAFMAFVKLSMVFGLVVSLPVIIYQIVAFVIPGLTKWERRWMLRLVPLTIILFLMGAAFAWYLVVPIMWRFFLSFQSEGVQALWAIGDVVGFVTGIILLCGVIFELPLVLIFMAFIGLIKSGLLVQYRKIIYFGALALSCVVTPTPDAFTAAIVALPIVALFEISILMIKMLGK